MRRQPSLDIVVAHYNEDLSWLKEEQDSCVVYSKGGAKNAPAFPPRVLPNIGREGHSYLTHIVEQYDSLADVTLFLQGRIDDHIPLNIQEIKARALETQTGQVTTFPFRELELFDHWDGIPWEDYPSWKKWTSMVSLKAPKTPAQYWQIFFPGREVPASVAFQPGALFAVRRETIQQHPKELYRLMLQEFFLGDMANINPETGHLMERFWLPIWNPSEYIVWHNEKTLPRKRRNRQGQLARGHWHVTPKGVEIDEDTLPPQTPQLATPPPSDDDARD